MPDGTVSVSCYEDGALLYTSVRTYGDGGKVHEEYLYPDGSTAVEDRVEDENGNYLSGASMWYDENGVFFRRLYLRSRTVWNILPIIMQMAVCLLSLPG